MSDANGTGRRFPVKRLIMGALKGAVQGLAIIGAIVLIGELRIDAHELASALVDAFAEYANDDSNWLADLTASFSGMKRGLLGIVVTCAVAYPLMDAVILYLATKNIPEG